MFFLESHYSPIRIHFCSVILLCNMIVLKKLWNSRNIKPPGLAIAALYIFTDLVKNSALWKKNSTIGILHTQQFCEFHSNSQNSYLSWNLAKISTFFRVCGNFSKFSFWGLWLHMHKLSFLHIYLNKLTLLTSMASINAARLCGYLPNKTK